MARYVVGVDEAGRGPLAGPVAVGIAVVPVDFKWQLLPGVNDSKKLSETAREEIFNVVSGLDEIAYSVRMVSPRVIDRVGITAAVRLAIKRGLVGVDAAEASVKLDGLLQAPSRFLDQETIVGGDGKEKVIGLASILAKVARDRYMVRLDRRYPEYGFAEHKGYGTKAHREMIEKYGLSDMHRRTYCQRLTFF